MSLPWIGLPLIQLGEKIYANFGYFHIQQENINGIKPLAKLIKDSCNLRIVSIVGMLTNSECLKFRKYKSEGSIIIRNLKKPHIEVTKPLKPMMEIIYLKKLTE